MPSTKPVIPPSGRDLDGAQDSGPVELIVVAVVEVPGQPLRQQSTVHLDDPALVRFVADLDDTEHVAADPGRRRARMVLERPEHGADRHLHLGRRFDVLEDQQPTLLEGLVEPVPHLRVGGLVEREAADAGTERRGRRGWDER